MKRKSYSGGFVSKLLQRVVESRKKDDSEISPQEDFKIELVSKEVQEWENTTLLNKDIVEQINAMWELPVIGHFFYLTFNVLSIEPISQFELERMLLMPQVSIMLAKVMTSMLVPPFSRAKLEVGPPMPYSIWTTKLKTKVTAWYRIYRASADQTLKVFEQIGIEPEFWLVMGETNPLKDNEFHELTFLQRVWLLKSMCDYLLHNHKMIQDVINNIEPEELREKCLGKDKQGSTYHYFPEFSEVRIYRQAKVVQAKWDGYDAGVEEVISVAAEDVEYQSPYTESFGAGIKKILYKPPRCMVPCTDNFKMVVSSVEDIRCLIDEFCKNDPGALQGRGTVGCLVFSLNSIINELEPIERKLLSSVSFIRNKMYKEWTDYQKRSPDYIDPGISYWERRMKDNPEREEKPLVSTEQPSNNENDNGNNPGSSTSSELILGEKRERRSKREPQIRYSDYEGLAESDEDEEEEYEEEDDSEEEWDPGQNKKRKQQQQSVNKKLKKLNTLSEQIKLQPNSQVHDVKHAVLNDQAKTGMMTVINKDYLLNKRGVSISITNSNNNNNNNNNSGGTNSYGSSGTVGGNAVSDNNKVLNIKQETGVSDENVKTEKVGSSLIRVKSEAVLNNCGVNSENTSSNVTSGGISVKQEFSTFAFDNSYQMSQTFDPKFNSYNNSNTNPHLNEIKQEFHVPSSTVVSTFVKLSTPVKQQYQPNAVSIKRSLSPVGEVIEISDEEADVKPVLDDCRSIKMVNCDIRLSDQRHQQNNQQSPQQLEHQNQYLSPKQSYNTSVNIRQTTPVRGSNPSVFVNNTQASSQLLNQQSLQIRGSPQQSQIRSPHTVNYQQNTQGSTPPRQNFDPTKKVQLQSPQQRNNRNFFVISPQQQQQQQQQQQRVKSNVGVSPQQLNKSPTVQSPSNVRSPTVMQRGASPRGSLNVNLQSILQSPGRGRPRSTSIRLPTPNNVSSPRGGNPMGMRQQSPHLLRGGSPQQALARQRSPQTMNQRNMTPTAPQRTTPGPFNSSPSVSNNRLQGNKTNQPPATSVQARRNLNFNSPTRPVQKPEPPLQIINTGNVNMKNAKTVEGKLIVGLTDDGNYGYHVVLPDGGKVTLTTAQLAELRSKNGGSLPQKVGVPMVQSFD